MEDSTEKLSPGEQYWITVLHDAEETVWGDVRESVRLVQFYLVGTLALTDIAEHAVYAMVGAWSQPMHVALLIHAMAEKGHRGVGP